MQSHALVEALSYSSASLVLDYSPCEDSFALPFREKLCLNLRYRRRNACDTSFLRLLISLWIRSFIIKSIGFIVLSNQENRITWLKKRINLWSVVSLMTRILIWAAQRFQRVSITLLARGHNYCVSVPYVTIAWLLYRLWYLACVNYGVLLNFIGHCWSNPNLLLPSISTVAQFTNLYLSFMGGNSVATDFHCLLKSCSQWNWRNLAVLIRLGKAPIELYLLSPIAALFQLLRVCISGGRSSVTIGSRRGVFVVWS